MDIAISILAVIIIIIIILTVAKDSGKETIHKRSTETDTYTQALSEIAPQKNYQPSKIRKKKAYFEDFEIKGIYYRDLDPEESGPFVGYLENDYANEMDPYAVAVYKANDLHIGFIPRGNRKLHNTIEQEYNSSLIAWGNLYYNEYENNWSGKVIVPMHFSPSDLINFRKCFELLDSIEQKTNLENENHIILDGINDLNELHRIVEIYGYIPGVSGSIGKTTLPSFSKRLEKEKDWERILKLESFALAINDLSETYRNAIFKRIERAKSKLSNLER